jgi:hypothetical protein
VIESLTRRTERMRSKVDHFEAPDGLPATRAVFTADTVQVYDDVLADPDAYRARAVALPFQSITVGAATFHGIAPCEDPTLLQWIVQRHPHARPGLTFFRRSPLGQVEPNFIHTDRDMGDWTAILYLNPDPLAGDGTTFWRHRRTGAMASTADGEAELLSEWQAWRDRSLWKPWRTVEARFNRLVLFPAPLFHSRALPDNYGGLDDARLIQLVFGRGSICPDEVQ